MWSSDPQVWSESSGCGCDVRDKVVLPLTKGFQISSVVLCFYLYIHCTNVNEDRSEDVLYVLMYYDNILSSNFGHLINIKQP